MGFKTWTSPGGRKTAAFLISLLEDQNIHVAGDKRKWKKLGSVFKFEVFIHQLQISQITRPHHQETTKLFIIKKFFNSCIIDSAKINSLMHFKGIICAEEKPQIIY